MEKPSKNQIVKKALRLKSSLAMRKNVGVKNEISLINMTAFSII